MPVRIPEWPAEDSKHRVPNYVISPDQAKQILKRLKESYPDLFTEDPYENGNGNGQKETKVSEWIESPCRDNNKGCVYFDEQGRPWLVKHPNWCDPRVAHERFEKPGLVPDSAVYPIDVVPRDLTVERKLVNPPERSEAAGCELEFAVGKFTGNKVVPINIQYVLDDFKKFRVSASIEGWFSQFEHPSKPKCTYSSFSDHREVLVKGLLVISKTLGPFDTYLLPTGVMPYSGIGQPNFENPHVRNVLTKGLEISLERELDLEEAADILAKYGVNGLHITVNLKKDENGFVEDERLKRVFELTHSPISFLLKSLTLSGNLESAEALVLERLSYRDIHRAELPTARVGRVRRLFDEEVVTAFEEGKAPSLERASLCDEEGKPARGVHNPLGRQKQSGRNEFTAFDIEPNVDKILALECLLSLFTTVVDKAVLEGKEDWLMEGIDDGKKYLFFSFLSNDKEYKQLSDLVETYGVDGLIKINKELKTVGEIILNFIDFVQTKAEESGILSEDSNEEKELLNYLRYIIGKHLEGRTADTFEEYLDPESELYAVGTVSEIARKRYKALQE